MREQVVVYLDDRDRALLEEMAEKTGLARTELFRRGLRRLAEETLAQSKPGSALDFLIATAADDGLPPDVAERHDEYLYGGGYEKKKPAKKRARPR
ncbi:MAG: ribbon-helix-helix protein, CopG family [Gemmatimonadota bacterium]